MSEFGYTASEDMDMHLSSDETKGKHMCDTDSSSGSKSSLHVFKESRLRCRIGRTPLQRLSREQAQMKRKLQQLDESDSDQEEWTPKKETPTTHSSDGARPGTSEFYKSHSSLNRGTSINDRLREIQQNQKDILAQLAIIRREIAEVKENKQEFEVTCPVPNKIRNAVKEFFSRAAEYELTWNYERSCTDDINKELTDFIKDRVKAIIPDVSPELLDVAVNRHFISKKNAASRQSIDKVESHRKRQATYERKKEKVRRRLVACENKANWTNEKRRSVKDVLTSRSSHNYMSSDEECDEGFITHPLSWESYTWRNVKDSLDQTYLDICPARSKRLIQKRTKGSIKFQDNPNVPERFAWIVQGEEDDI